MRTALEEIRAKTGPIQTVLKVHMTMHSLQDLEPDYERYGREALVWWDRLTAEFNETPPERLAKRMVLKFRKQEGWGKILRGGREV